MVKVISKQTEHRTCTLIVGFVNWKHYWLKAKLSIGFGLKHPATCWLALTARLRVRQRSSRRAVRASQHVARCFNALTQSQWKASLLVNSCFQLTNLDNGSTCMFYILYWFIYTLNHNRSVSLVNKLTATTPTSYLHQALQVAHASCILVNLFSSAFYQLLQAHLL